MTQNTKGRQNASEKKVKKGDFGYFQSEKEAKADHYSYSFCCTSFYLFYIMDLFQNQNDHLDSGYGSGMSPCL